MKKLLLLSISVLAWMVFINAQSTQNNNGGNNFRRPMKDSTHRMPPNGFRPGGPGGNQWGNQPGRGGFARGNFNRGFNKGQKMGMLARLHPTPEQMKQGKAINQEYKKQLADLQKNDKISLGEYKTKLAALKKDRKNKLMALLNDRQKSQIAQQKKNQEINAKVRQAGMLERMKLTLGLSEDQIAKIKSAQAALQSKTKAIRDNDNLLPEQKKEQLQSLMKERKDIAKNILTPEQQAKADSMMKNRRPGGNWGGGGRWNQGNRPPMTK